MKLQPLYDFVAVKRNDAESETKGGILIPQNVVMQKLPLATVVAVGTGRPMADGTLAPLQVKEGDTVVIGAYGVEIELGGEKLLLMREHEIVAKIEGELELEKQEPKSVGRIRDRVAATA